ncbi:MAG: AMP-binding protein [Gammaproteobacteria bacterium]|nr:MAG: AMP-binding protein [Gammaproteobacteria bacterium]UCH38865.1 MAG: AMP-binding protein [Gammaproteobacteria bacterium]
MNRAGYSYFHRGGEPPLLGSTIGEHFSAVIDSFPQHEAVVSIPQQRRLSYRQFGAEVEQLARGLTAMGFGHGDRIGIWSTNNIEWLLVQMASACIGAILVNINPAYRPRELSYALKQSEVQGLFVIAGFRQSDYVGMLLELIPEMRDGGAIIESADFPHLSRVFLFDSVGSDRIESTAPGFSSWQDLLDSAQQVSLEKLQRDAASLDRDDVINIQYTSGTTGTPKAVMLTHHNILNNAWFSAQTMHFGAHDRLAVPVPFYHCFGMVLSSLMCLSVGACVVIACEHFDASDTLAAIESEKCSAIHGVPTMFIEMLQHPEFARFDLNSLRTGIMAGAPCPPELMTRVIEDMHCSEILIGYGQTEASPLTHLTTREDSFERRIETVGRNLPHQEVKIIDTDSGATVSHGEIGEICFRGYHVMRGYYGEADKTKQAIDAAGWLFSGDLGSMDAEGYLRITGRRKEMIIRGGENIYPREIEDFLFTHPKIAEVAVFGVDDERLGEQVAAWIQLHRPGSAEAEEIREFCRDNIAHFKIPEYIRFVDDFPMTVTGKLQKFKMREIMQRELYSKAESERDH